MGGNFYGLYILIYQKQKTNKKAILVVVDKLSKASTFSFLYQQNIKAEDTAKVFYNEV